VKLLKAIEDRSVRRLGGLRQKTVDVRIVAATNGDLDRAAHEGAFRSDLLYRLKVLTLVLVPLRERAEDVVPLAQHFLGEAGRRYRRPRRLTEDAEAGLRAYGWPGNVREVANVIERAVLLHEGDDIGADVLGLPSPARAGAPVEVGAGRGVKVDFSQGGVSLSELERTLIAEALKTSGGNRRRAAELLGISLETLRYRMEKHALGPGDHEAR
jgi:DNA-binding NtrC family response regulator